MDKLLYATAWAIAKDTGLSCVEDAMAEACQILDVEPLQPTPLEVLRQPVHNQAEIDALAVAVLMRG